MCSYLTTHIFFEIFFSRTGLNILRYNYNKVILRMKITIGIEITNLHMEGLEI